MALAGEPFDWDRYHAREDACLEQDRIGARFTMKMKCRFSAI
jgi:hypothetical protein